MAKRVVQKIRGVQKSNPTSGASLKGRKDWKASLSAFVTAPATMYVAGGIGLAVLGRFAFKYYQSHPEISDYIKENYEAVESKIHDYRISLASSNEDMEDTTV